jgi:nitrite reductase/ring-hydroxylating ferredoxin subunit/uncharacterized membrane protein
MAGLVERTIRRQRWTEPVSDAVQKWVGGFYGALGSPGKVLKNLAHGTLILRHPLHPALTDVPLGAWTVGVIADYVAHFNTRIPESAGDIALAVGLAVGLLTVLTGYTDFHETFGLERRFAVVHGLMMTIVFAIDALSLALRWWTGENLHPLAVGLSTGAWALLIAAAWLGGHVVFGTGTMVNRGAFLEGPDDWVDAGAAGEVPASGMHLVEAGGMKVVIARDAGRICAFAAVCSHAGGPLEEGTLEDGVVTCPWHGSRFRIRDGRAVGGPATFDQATLEVRELEGNLQVKLSEPLH